jgi:hypothetical protein
MGRASSPQDAAGTREAAGTDEVGGVTDPGDPNGASAIAARLIADDEAHNGTIIRDGKVDGGRVGKVVVGTTPFAGSTPLGARTIFRPLAVATAFAVLAGAGVGIYLATNGNSGTKQTATVPAGGIAVGSKPTPTPPQLAFAPNTVFDGCIFINPQGSTTTLGVALTVANPEPGNYTATFGQSPSGPLGGTGTATNGANPIVIPITATAFGPYDQLSITAPGGTPVQPGPLTGQLPLSLNASTDMPNGCSPTALKTPLPGTAASSADVQEVTTFLDGLAHDIATGNIDQELAALNPAVVQRYGDDQCRSFLATLTDPTAAFTVKEVTGPESFDYAGNGLTTTVPNTFYADVTAISHGQAVDQTVHVARANNALSFFAACGTPLKTASD